MVYAGLRVCDWFDLGVAFVCSFDVAFGLWGCLWIVFAFKFGWVFWVYFVWFGLLYGLVLVLGVCVSNFAVGLVWCVCLSVAWCLGGLLLFVLALLIVLVM